MTQPNESSACPNVATCPMFAIFSFANTLDVWKDNYCHADYSRCERWKRVTRGGSVPTQLLPNGKLLRK